MGRHFLTERFLLENADSVQLKYYVGMWLFQWKCPQERITMVEEMLLAKNQRVRDSSYKCQQSTVLLSSDDSFSRSAILPPPSGTKNCKPL